ncbi:MAG TPA: tRNA (adenosine(37)-N6)-dimethylallyltransferase MiaA [bacterium]|nr:tRNA (adenosine(37)-N6)-dimethylallyltransferase MiaA [bacterium]
MVQETPVIAIFGPTASGKTLAAMELAAKLGGEIVSVDSGQIYRGMNIGTAKPTAAERKTVPFHLIDVVDPSEAFSAARFSDLASPVMDEIASRGRRPILTVGTGLYFRTLEGGLFEGPKADPELRARLERRLEEEGIEVLEVELRKIDPEASKTVTKNNRQRLIRALEVYHLTGKPISEHWRSHRAKKKGDPLGRLFLKVGLNPSKEELDRRIEERLEGMIEQGLLAETRALLERWGPRAPGLQLIGYKEIVAYLSGKSSLEAAIALVLRNTRQYAKRQRTWFKKDREIQWFESPDRLTQGLTLR